LKRVETFACILVKRHAGGLAAREFAGSLAAAGIPADANARDTMSQALQYGNLQKDLSVSRSVKDF
jgi:hypothetical protein